MPLPTTERVESLLAGIDGTALQRSWQTVVDLGDQVPLHFYSSLYLMSLELSELFPVSMGRQRVRIMIAIGDAVASIGSVQDFLGAMPTLAELGRAHRKYGVVAAHYPVVGSALILTLQYFLGDVWNETLRRSWMNAYALVSDVMTGAARDEEAAGIPSWWDSVIEAMTPIDDDALTIMLKPALPYEIGSCTRTTICHHGHPGMWLTVPMAPTLDGGLQVRVQVVERDQASMDIAYSSSVGDYVRLGPPLAVDPSEEEQ